MVTGYLKMALHSFSNEAFPQLLSFFSPAQTGWRLLVPDIGANSGFPGPFDWNDHFDDDDGALIVSQTSFPEISEKPGFKAIDEETGRYAFISFLRSARWEDGVLNYCISLPEVGITSEDREPGVNMELSAALAAVCLQMNTDWLWLISKHKGRETDWTIRTIVEIGGPVPDSVRLGLYEISHDAACRLYDEHPKIGQFTGFEEPGMIVTEG
jgi:hypothetical protein